MRHLWLAFMSAGAAALTLVLAAVPVPVEAQAPAYRAARTPDGRPDLNGIWQAINTANWDIQDHSARKGDILALGAAFSVPGGPGVVEGNEIPYRPEALARKQENAANWVKNDPEIKCYLPGVPRANYMPYPFQIVQGPASSDILMAYEFADATRIIHMNTKDRSPVDSWMGWSIGRWDGDTLVVEVTDFNGETWFDRAGNYHSEALHVTERYTPVSPERLRYEVTIDDPKVFTRPWKMQMPLYRRTEPNARLTEYKCVEFVEELIYGEHYKKP